MGSVGNNNNLSAGQQYIQEQGREVSYEAAIANSLDEMKNAFVTNNTNVLPLSYFIDNTPYPLNAKLYDEFTDNVGFYTDDYIAFIAKRSRGDYTVYEDYDTDNNLQTSTFVRNNTLTKNGKRKGR